MKDIMSNEFLSIAIVRDFVRVNPRRCFHLRLKSRTMAPAIQEGELLTLSPAGEGDLAEGDVVLASQDGWLRVSRIVLRRGDFFLLKGDALKSPESPVEIHQILGKVESHRPYSMFRGFVSGIKSKLAQWLSFQLCEMILERQSREI